MEALPGYSWLHLACHGVQNQRDANLSAFLLHDQRLTLADLTTVTLPEADLAYLSACQTATGDLDLTDEHLHLAAGLQLIGYRHVLATLWSISDRAAPAMAQAVYEHLTQSDAARQPDANRAAQALHHAVARLRRSAPADPLIWAPFIHLGP
jgi:CHAT domain-containing protein